MKQSSFCFALFAALVIFHLVGLQVILASQKIRPVKGNRDYSVETDLVKIRAVGNTNIPSFFVEKRSETDTKRYKVGFTMAYQVTSLGEDFEENRINPPYNLNRFTWDFSDFASLGEGDDETLSFNVTSTGVSGNPPQDMPSFQFRIHVNTKRPGMKWDTIIGNMNSWNPNATGLSVCYKLLEQDRNAEPDEERASPIRSSTNTRIYFGENGKVSLGINPHGNERYGRQRDVVLRIALGNMGCVLYEKFNGTLVHDPEFVVGSHGTVVGVPQMIAFVSMIFVSFLCFIF